MLPVFIEHIFLLNCVISCNKNTTQSHLITFILKEKHITFLIITMTFTISQTETLHHLVQK